MLKALTSFSRANTCFLKSKSIMPTKTTDWSTTQVDAYGTPFTGSYLHQDSNSTLTPSGRIDRRAQNSLYRYLAKTEKFNQLRTESSPGSGFFHATRPMTAGGMSPPPGFDTTSANNTALAKWNGKLKKGGASMGVTLASWKQSREMIVNRARAGAKALDREWSELVKDTRRHKRLQREREPLANQVLETEFGWMPLFQDIHACMTSVCQDGVPPQWLSARHTQRIRYSQVTGGWGSTHETKIWDGYYRCTLAGNVQITNPNLWLANRLGLINPATVIWDLVPWSFVVNMFVNVNAMISSVTNEVGLDITNRSTTKSTYFTCESNLFSTDGSNNPVAYPGPSDSVCSLTVKQRDVGSFPTPHWEFRVPELNWELAMIASSLLLQKAQRLNNLVKGF